MRKLISSLLIYSLIAQSAVAGTSRFQDVQISGSQKIGDSTPADSKAVLDVQSTTKGVLIPRMTQAQRDAIIGPTAGLEIYNTTTQMKNLYQGGIWVAVATDLDTQTLSHKTLSLGLNTITSTADKAAQFNSTTGKLEPSLISTTELGFLSGASSNLQGQITSNTNNIGANTTSITTNKGTMDAHIAASTSVHGISDTAQLVTKTGAQVLTNKDIDGGTASNTSRITLPKDTFTNLQSLTRKEGTLVYAKDQAKAYVDNGTALVGVGSGSGGDSGNLFTDGGFETDTSNITTLNSATATTDTTNVFNGAKSAALTFSSTSSSALMTMTPTAQLKGVWMEASCRVKTSVVGLQLCALDNGTEYSCQSIPTGDWAYVPSNWQPGVNGNAIGLKVKATSNSGSLNIDYCYVGVARNMGATLVSTAPTVQRFTSGSGTYTVPSNPSPLYIEIEMVGGGGGGGSGGISSNNNGTAGSNTTFGTSLLVANGGSFGIGGNNPGGLGGTSSCGTVSTCMPLQGGAGQSGQATQQWPSGGMGGASPFGGAGAGLAPNASATANQAIANTGSGGGGGSITAAGAGVNAQSGAGGGAGGYLKAVIQSPTGGSSYSYTVGSGGSGGAAGTSGVQGGNGGSGVVIVREFYGNNTNTFYQATSGGLNAGDILPTAASVCPTGTIAADGSNYLRTDYPALYAAIGTAYGAVDSTHFNAPDYRWMFGRGYGGVSGGTISAVSGNSVTITGHKFNHSGIPVQFTGSLPTGLSTGTTYYEIYVDANTIQLATTQANALAGTAITLSSTTTGGVAVNWQDPDSSSRLAMAPGGNTGNALGTVQGDIVKQHTHQVDTYATAGSTGPAISNASTANGNYQSLNTGNMNGGLGGNETRGKNIYVNYCVRTVPASPGPVILPNSASSSSTGTNYVTGGDAESGTNQCTPYANTAAVAPTTGTGGSPTVTCSISTSSPITGNASYVLNKPASNVQGQGWSFPITVSNEGKAKMLQVSFDYSVDSNYTVGSDTTTPDIVAYIYGPTDGTPQLYQLTPYKALGGTGFLKFQGNFQTALSGSAYRLILHEPNTGTLASTIKVDNIVASPVLRQFGTPVTDWQAYTMTIGGSTTAPTTNSPVINLAQWRRVGDSMEIRYNFYQNAAGSGGSGAYLFQLPPGYSIDTTKISTSTNGNGAGGSIVGVARMSDTSASSTANAAFGDVIPYNTTSVAIYDNAGAAASQVVVGSTHYSLVGSSVFYSIEARLPIQGWSSSTQMSDQSGDNRIVSFTAQANTNQTVGTGVNLHFPDNISDSHGAWNGTDTYKIPVAGDYWVNASVNASTPSSGDLYLYKNGSSVTHLTSWVSTSNCYNGGALVRGLKAGDLITMQHSVSTATFPANGGLCNNVGIFRLSGNQQIAASESVSFHYNIASGFNLSANSGTTLTFGAKDWDSHNAFNGTTFTAPGQGKYEFTSFIRLNNSGFTVGTTLTLDCIKGGTNVGRMDYYQTYSGQNFPSLKGSCTVQMNAGDTITFLHNNTNGGGLVTATGTEAWIAGKKVGN